jgi:hypothetical protein
MGWSDLCVSVGRRRCVLQGEMGAVATAAVDRCAGTGTATGTGTGTGTGVDAMSTWAQRRSRSHTADRYCDAAGGGVPAHLREGSPSAAGNDDDTDEGALCRAIIVERRGEFAGGRGVATSRSAEDLGARPPPLVADDGVGGGILGSAAGAPAPAVVSPAPTGRRTLPVSGSQPISGGGLGCCCCCCCCVVPVMRWGSALPAALIGDW